ncbi:hypothetical protein KIN20_013546 [Parelaphostrongylus tenuis]|uniref:Uncharacterized protein n=1 Tax=Parelaphostrongylus tenuis TaxID=148309 RepID=A0AAD5QMN7_PARTN|nr:hypothetical protein KIN20_013546 [Parelaphostrongylus tenuis]
MRKKVPLPVGTIASTHLSGNDVPLQVIRSSDEENVSKSLQDSGLRFKKTESNENPIVKGAQRDLRCNPLRNKAEFRDRGEGDNSENDVPLCASLSSNDEETMKTTSTRRQIRAISYTNSNGPQRSSYISQNQQAIRPKIR